MIFMKITRYFILVNILFCLFITGISARDTDSVLIHKYEIIISGLFDNISVTSDELQREQINNEIIKNLENVLLIEGSFTYSFDSLKNLGKIASPDMKIRIYTWNLPYSNGSHIYYGFIQYKPSDGNKILIFKLTDKSDILEQPEKQVLSDTNWFGALYYEIIEKEYNNEKYYTLLGIDFNSLLTNKKIIELLQFTSDNIPVFGKPVFNYQNEIYTRIIFEYSKKAAMGLKYNNELEMIVYDHLSPSKPSYQVNYMYY
jgi:hypothetical protein